MLRRLKFYLAEQNFHLFSDFFEVVTDAYLLRTHGLALTALDTGIRSLGFGHLAPLPLRSASVHELVVIVPDREVLGNVNSHGTRHTVSAAGTAVLGAGGNFFIDLLHSRHFFIA